LARDRAVAAAAIAPRRAATTGGAATSTHAAVTAISTHATATDALVAFFVAGVG